MQAFETHFGFTNMVSEMSIFRVIASELTNFDLGHPVERSRTSGRNYSPKNQDSEDLNLIIADFAFKESSKLTSHKILKFSTMYSTADIDEFSMKLPYSTALKNFSMGRIF